MSKFLSIFCFILTLSLWCEHAHSEDLHKLERQGTEYRLLGDFEAAAMVQAQLLRQADTPVGHVFALNTIVTQLTWDESVTSMDEPLLLHAEQTLNWCESRLKTEPGNVLANFYCGQASFALSYFHGLRGNFYQAGRQGTRSIEYLEAALAGDPAFVDAKLYLGVAYFVADNLPPYVRMFSRLLWFIPTGNSEKSLPYIRDVIRDSDHYDNVARYIFSSLAFSNDETLKTEARAQLYELIQRYPRNPRFQLRLAAALLLDEQYEGSLSAARAYLNSKEPPDEPYLSLIKVLMIRAHMELDQIREAKRLFAEASPVLTQAAEELPDWSLSWYLLTDAQLHDLSQQRSRAIEIYNRIIGMARTESVSSVILDAARSGVVRPYRIAP